MIESLQSEKSLTVKEFRQLAMRPLVYGWCRKGVYLYIGQTQRGFARLVHTHDVINRVEPWLDDDYLDFWFPEPEDVRNLERRLIRLHMPKYNGESRPKVVKGRVVQRQGVVTTLSVNEVSQEEAENEDMIRRWIAERERERDAGKTSDSA